MIINEDFLYDDNMYSSLLIEGVTYNKDEGNFLFNFSHDNDNDIIKLKNIGHKSDYFSIARDIKKTKYRPYIKNYYKFKDEKDKKLFKLLDKSNVLVVDDIATSGTIIFHLLKTIRTLNDKNSITVFSLLGKNLEI